MPEIKYDGLGRQITTGEEIKISAGVFDHGSKGSIGTSAIQITTTSVTTIRGVLIKAAIGNSGTVYVGNSDVTADAVAATDGFELGAGDAVTVEVDNVNKVFVIGSATGQKVFWLTV